MKKTLLITALVGLMAMPVMAQDDSSQLLAKKIDLSKKYLEVVSVGEDVENAIEQLSLQVPADKKPLMVSILKRTINEDRLKTVSELALAEIFTLAELQAMVDFYSSDEGQAVRQKMPEYKEKIRPVLEQMIIDSIEAYKAQTK